MLGRYFFIKLLAFSKKFTITEILFRQNTVTIRLIGTVNLLATTFRAMRLKRITSKV